MKREEALARIAELEEQVEAAAAFRVKATEKLRELKSKVAAAEREVESTRELVEKQKDLTARANGRIATLLNSFTTAARVAGWIGEDEALSGPQALLLMEDFAQALEANAEVMLEKKFERLLNFLGETAYVSSGTGWVFGRRIPNRDKGVTKLEKEERIREFQKDLEFALEMHRRHVLAKEKGII